MGKISIELWKKYMNVRKKIHRDILTVLIGSEHCDQIIDDSHDFNLPEEDANDLIATGHIFLSLWYGLSQHFKAEEVPLFGMTTKQHYLMHGFLLSRLDRPSF